MPRGAPSVKINFVGPKAQQQKLAHGATVLCKLRASTGEDDPLETRTETPILPKPSFS